MPYLQDAYSTHGSSPKKLPLEVDFFTGCSQKEEKVSFLSSYWARPSAHAVAADTHWPQVLSYQLLHPSLEQLAEEGCKMKWLVS